MHEEFMFFWGVGGGGGGTVSSTPSIPLSGSATDKDTQSDMVILEVTKTLFSQL